MVEEVVRVKEGGEGNEQARTKNVALSARGAAFSEIHWTLPSIKRCGGKRGASRNRSYYAVTRVLVI